jgi:hypothetical protein
MFLGAHNRYKLFVNMYINWSIIGLGLSLGLGLGLGLALAWLRFRLNLA